MEKKPDTLSEKQSVGEEIANSVTHGIGALLGIAALVILVVFASQKGDVWRIVSFSVYGAALIILFTMSVLSHSLTNKKAKNVFEILDHSAVYFLIAATYTPITLVFLRGSIGWALFGVIWGLAAIGIVFKVFFTGRYIVLSSAIYIAMGWLVIFAIKPLIKSASKGFIIWLLIGGLCFTLGIVFYLARKMPYHHFIWHIFVLAGAICIFFGFLFYGI